MLQQAPHGVADLHTSAEELPIPHVIDEFEGRRVLGYAQNEPTIGTVDPLCGHLFTSRSSKGREDMKFGRVPAIKRSDERDKNICCLKFGARVGCLELRATPNKGSARVIRNKGGDRNRLPYRGC